jgi:glutaconate CoA-transferase subunit B
MTQTEAFTSLEQMIITASRFIEEGEVVYVGAGLPVAASFLAKYLQAPNATIVFETGVIRSIPCELPIGTDSIGTQSEADLVSDGLYVNSLAQRGRFTLGFMGAGQVDRYGNVNSTVVGDLENPTLRYPGGGGACEISSLCRRTVIILRQKRQRFPEKIAYITAPGYLDGRPNSRTKAGLPNDTGPFSVITDMATYRFENCEMVLNSVHEGVTVDEVESNVGWKLRVPEDMEVTPNPTVEELRTLREVVDTNGLIQSGRYM